MNITRFLIAALSLAAPGFAVLGLPSVATAQEQASDTVFIAPDMPSATVETESGPVEISRVQDQTAKIEGDWGLIARSCPQNCIQPMSVAPGVLPVGELELIAMLQDPDVMVIDTRVLKWYKDGTIPGSVHIPFTDIVDQLDTLGCEPGFDGWECDAAKTVALFCNGPWCRQSPTAIAAMLAEGYPAERIFYYRGGMQMWRMFGLTVAQPAS